MKSSLLVVWEIALTSAIGLQVNACTKEQAAQVISAGSGAGELICAVLLEPNGTEREICDTGAKLAELLGKLLMTETKETSPAQSALPAAMSAAPMTSTAPPATATASKPRTRLLRLYVKPSQGPAEAGAD
ncbi:MAG: hypothetical protein PHX83_14525 [Acidobacteriia bacterium]|nr:hypothetical protein [Terriglobia bacterium]